MKEMQQKNIVEDITLEVLTPLHIGGVFPEINPLLYIYNGAYAVVMKEKSLAEKLIKKNIVDPFIDYVNSSKSPSLNQFFYDEHADALQNECLKQCCLHKIAIAKDCRFKSGCKFRQLTRFDDPDPRGENVKAGEKLDPGVKNIYIPGSSIKGAIREAFLSHSIAQNQSIWDKYKRDVLAKRSEDTKDEKVTAKIDQMLQKGEDDPKNDILKFFRVSDAIITKKSRCERYSEIKAVKVISVNDEYQYHESGSNKKTDNSTASSPGNGFTIFVETVTPNIKFVCTVTIDIAGLEAFCAGKNISKDDCNSIAAMLKNWKKICMKRYSKLLSDEIDFFKKVEATEPGLETVPKTVKISENLEKLEALGVSLRLGWGSGILSTTQISELAPDERVKIRENYYEKKQQRKTQIFPQSRKVVWNGKEYVSTLGWVKISSKERKS